MDHKEILTITATIAPTLLFIAQWYMGIFRLPERMEHLERRFDKLENSIEGLKDALITGLISKNGTGSKEDR